MPLWIAGLIALALGSASLPGNSPTVAEKAFADDKLASIRERVPKAALSPMTREGYPKLFKRLGKETFNRGNELALWAGIAAAENDACPNVTAIGVSDTAARSDLKWFVNCDNNERFIVSEKQAHAAKVRFDTKATFGERRAAEAVAVVKPRSARWKNFNEVNAITLCDRMVRETAVSKNSVSLSWSPKVLKDESNGRVTIERDFDADNAFGGTISSRYRCELNGDDGDLKQFWVRQVDGWKKLY